MQLPGEDVLLGSWRAIAQVSPDARVVQTSSGAAAVFPHWAPLNNAVLQGAPPTSSTASAAAEDLRALYASVPVEGWALWLPSGSRDLRAADAVHDVAGMSRDTTTLVMVQDVQEDLPPSPRVVRTSVEAAARAGDDPVPAVELPDPDGIDGLDAWALVDGESAVAGAWSFRSSEEVGIYAVGTVPRWRRRGLARELMLHVLSDVRRAGALSASLQSTAMGQPLYESLGFRAVGRYEEWVPTDM